MKPWGVALIAVAIAASAAGGYHLGRMHGVVLATPALATELQPAAASAANRVVSKQAWDAALATALEQREPNVGADGVTKFKACVKDANGCTLQLPGSRDALRKVLWVYASEANSKGPPKKTRVDAYVALQDCGLPTVFISPFFVREGDWLFLKSITAAVGEKTVLSQPIDNAKRDNTSGWVMEWADLALPNAALPDLEAASSADALIVRLTGDRGYITLDADRTRTFRASLAEVLAAHARIHKAVAKIGRVGAECQS